MPSELPSQSKSKNKIPMMELAGPQLDGSVLRKFISGIVGKISLVLVGIGLVVALWFVFPAGKAHRTMLGKLNKYEPSKFRNKISLVINDRERLDEISVLLFKTEPRKGHSWLLLDLTIINQADMDFRVNTSAFGLRTASGETYMPHHHTRMIRDGLDNDVLEPEEDIRGNLLFEIPQNRRATVLVIRDMSGPITQTEL